MHDRVTSPRNIADRLLALASSLFLALALAVPAAPVWAQDSEAVASDRIEGPDRFATAAELALATFETSQAAIIASGENWPDALVASYGPLGTESPILLSLQDEVPQMSLDVLDELGVRTVYLMGGEVALHADVEAQLRAAGYDELFRVGGADRYATAARMLDGPQEPRIGTLDGDATALLASGEDFADALSAGPVAASANLPLLLTPAAVPHPRTDAALATHDIERVVIIGGQDAVSSAVVEHYRDEGYEVERWGGETRTETAGTVADNAIERFAFTPARVLLARGDTFPDALTASVHGGIIGAPLVLSTDADTLSGETRSWLQTTCPDVDSIRAVGGPAALTEDVLAEAVEAAEACHDTPTLPTGIDVSDEQITDQDGNVLLSMDDLPDNVEPDPGAQVGGPTRFTDAVLSGDRAWIAIGSAGAVHGYGWLYDVVAQEHHFVAFQFEGAVGSHSWSPDDRFALFTIGTPADTDLLKVVDRDDLQPYPSETGFVVEVEEEGDPPFTYEFVAWQAPHTLCFAFDATPYCIDAANPDPEPAG